MKLFTLVTSGDHHLYRWSILRTSKLVILELGKSYLRLCFFIAPLWIAMIVLSGLFQVHPAWLTPFLPLCMLFIIVSEVPSKIAFNSWFVAKCPAGSRVYAISIAWHTLHGPGTPLEDEGLKHLATCSKLKLLGLWDTNITDDGLAHISKLTALEDLQIRRTNVTDEGLKHLTKMKALRKGCDPKTWPPRRSR